jgi:hypothetical protein
MQQNALRQVRLQVVSDADGSVFCRTKQAGHNTHLPMQVVVVHLIGHPLPDQGTWPLYIHPKACLLRWLALYSNQQLLSMPAPVA